MGAAKQVAVLINTPLNVKIISCIKVQVEFDNKHETEKISDIGKLSQTRWTVRASC